MRFSDYSHRHGKELLSLTHPEEYGDIASVLTSLDPFPHGVEKNKTPKEYIAEAFEVHRWDIETEIPLGTGKSDYCDLSKNGIFIEQEYSRFEMFFRDFFRFLLLHDERQLDIGVMITYDDSAFDRWGTAVSSYRAARASLGKLIDFLEGKYSAVVRVPIWCIGIE
jgi:hypothetical protein